MMFFMPYTIRSRISKSCGRGKMWMVSWSSAWSGKEIHKRQHCQRVFGSCIHKPICRRLPQKLGHGEKSPCMHLGRTHKRYILAFLCQDVLGIVGGLFKQIISGSLLKGVDGPNLVEALLTQTDTKISLRASAAGMVVIA